MNRFPAMETACSVAFPPSTQYQREANMRHVTVYSILLAAIFLFSSATQGAGPVFDGNFWRACPDETKNFFVHGIMGGILLGQDRVIRYGLPDKAAQSVDADCQRVVVGVVNSLERQMESWDRDYFVKALDAFYSDPDHRSLDIRWAVMVVMLELHDAKPEEIEKAPPESSR